VPQIAEGSAIAAHLQAWRAGLPPSPALPFAPSGKRP
jgi:hypothetical protein